MLNGSSGQPFGCCALNKLFCGQFDLDFDRYTNNARVEGYLAAMTRLNALKIAEVNLANHVPPALQIGLHHLLSQQPHRYSDRTMKLSDG